MKKLLIALLLIVPTIILASPTSVNRIDDHIEPLIRSDYIKGSYFVASSTTATSTFAGDITQGLGKILTTHSVRSDASDGVLLQANNYTNVGLFGAGNTSNSLFYGGVNIDGATRLATSLSGCVRALLGVISASGTCAPYPFTPATNYAVTNQATTGIPWFQNGMNASTTSRFVHTNAGSLVVGADVNTGDFVQYSDTFDRNAVNSINWTVTGTNFTQYGVMGGRGNGASWSANGFTGTQPYRRNNTLTFMADVTPGTSADFMIGLSSSPSSLNFTNMPHAIRFISSNTTNVYENGTDRGSVSASWVASTTYRIKIVVNPTGAIYYRSSNGGDTWTKLYNGTANNITTTPLYPSLTAVGTGFLHVDNVSISNGFDVLTASQFVPKNFTVGEGDLLVNGGKVTVATTSATSTFAGGVAFSRSVTMATTNGNVGINTATPSQKLDVVGTIQGSNFNGNVNASSTFTGLISGAVGANLTLNVNTANNLILNPSGAKVGIGGTPAFNLDVFSPVTGISVDNVMRITSAARFVGNTVNATYPGGLGQANFIFQKLGVQTWSIGSDFAADGTKDFFFYDNTNLNNPLYVSNTGDLRLGSAGTAATGGYNGTQRATLKADTGNLGIGNTSPTYKLDVTGNARFTSLVDASHFVATSTSATSTFAGGLSVAGSTGLTVLQNGNVGINKIAPADSLDILGDVKIMSAANNTTAFSILPLSSGAPVFVADTTNRRIGMGLTVTPSYSLDLGYSDSTAYSASSVTPQGLRILNNDTTANSTAPIYFGLGGTGTAYAAINGVRESADNSSLTFRTEGSGTIAERMRITSAGFVGIGTTTPYLGLSVADGGVFGADVRASTFTATSTTATSTFAGKIQADSYSGSNGTPGFSGTCTLASITTITVEDGLITACN